MNTVKLNPKAVKALFDDTRSLMDYTTLEPLVGAPLVRRGETPSGDDWQVILHVSRFKYGVGKLRRHNDERWETWGREVYGDHSVHELACEMHERGFKVSLRKTQYDVIMALHEMLYPGIWDQIERLTDHPTCNYNTSVQIARLFMDFDRKHHPNVQPGGIWLNNGFSHIDSDDLGDWEVRPCGFIPRQHQLEEVA